MAAKSKTLSVCMLWRGEASNVEAMLFCSALVQNISFEGNPQGQMAFFLRVLRSSPTFAGLQALTI